MKIKSQKDFWSGVMFMAVGIAFAWGATSYSFGASARPGPGYFPFGLGVLLALLGALILFSALTIETDDGEPVGRIAWRPLSILTAAVVLFGLTLPSLGMVVALPLMIVVSALAGDEFHWGEAIASSVVLTVASWFIFIWGLGLTIQLWPKFIG